jgi:hypothetical protein
MKKADRGAIKCVVCGVDFSARVGAQFCSAALPTMGIPTAQSLKTGNRDIAKS